MRTRRVRFHPSIAMEDDESLSTTTTTRSSSSPATAVTIGPLQVIPLDEECNRHDDDEQDHYSSWYSCCDIQRFKSGLATEAKALIARIHQLHPPPAPKPHHQKRSAGGSTTNNLKRRVPLVSSRREKQDQLCLQIKEIIVHTFRVSAAMELQEQEPTPLAPQARGWKRLVDILPIDAENEPLLLADAHSSVAMMEFVGLERWMTRRIAVDKARRRHQMWNLVRKVQQQLRDESTTMDETTKKEVLRHVSSTVSRPSRQFASLLAELSVMMNHDDDNDDNDDDDDDEQQQ